MLARPVPARFPSLEALLSALWTECAPTPRLEEEVVVAQAGEGQVARVRLENGVRLNAAPAQRSSGIEQGGRHENPRRLLHGIPFSDCQRSSPLCRLQRDSVHRLRSGSTTPRLLHDGERQRKL